MTARFLTSNCFIRELKWPLAGQVKNFYKELCGKHELILLPAPTWRGSVPGMSRIWWRRETRLTHKKEKPSLTLGASGPRAMGFGSLSPSSKGFISQKLTIVLRLYQPPTLISVPQQSTSPESWQARYQEEREEQTLTAIQPWRSSSKSLSIFWQTAPSRALETERWLQASFPCPFSSRHFHLDLPLWADSVKQVNPKLHKSSRCNLRGVGGGSKTFYSKREDTLSSWLIEDRI